jgi:hypothetical protein
LINAEKVLNRTALICRDSDFENCLREWINHETGSYPTQVRDSEVKLYWPMVFLLRDELMMAIISDIQSTAN